MSPEGNLNMLAKKKKVAAMKYLGEAVLHQKAQPVAEINDDIRNLAQLMLETMYHYDGVGLAAPQIGVSKRIVTLDVPPPRDPNAVLSPGERELLSKMPLVLINPEIVSSSPVLEYYEEGCLSVPKLYAPVERPVSVVLKAKLLDGPEILLDCGGFLARAIQHELDHLDGIVYVQKVKSPAFEEIQPQLKTIIKKYGARGYKLNRLV